MTERCNLCGAALVSHESIDDGACWPTCDDLEFDRMVDATDDLEEAFNAPWPGPRNLPPTGLMPDDADEEFDLGGEGGA